MNEEKKDYEVVPFDDGRFAIQKDGVIIDDAQGWGYKTRQAAHKAMYYKLNKGSIDNENRTVVSFMKKNKSFAKDVESAMFYAVKDKEKFTADDLQDIANENSLTLPFDASKFLKIMHRKSCKW